MRSSLSIRHLADRDRAEFGRVVLCAKSCGGKKEAKNLRVGSRGPLREKEQQQERKDSSEQATQQVKRRGAQAHREEKQFSLRPENRERPRERPMHHIHPPDICHNSPAPALLRRYPGNS